MRLVCLSYYRRLLVFRETPLLRDRSEEIETTLHQRVRRGNRETSPISRDAVTYNSRTPAMDADPLDVSIVLVNWNACEMTTAAVRSIGDQTRVTHEIIVIDNASTQGVSAHELPKRFPALTFIPNTRNLGFGAASNQGIAVSRGRYVLLLNTDTIQTEDAIGAAVRYMDGHAERGRIWNPAP